MSNRSLHAELHFNQHNKTAHVAMSAAESVQDAACGHDPRLHDGSIGYHERAEQPLRGDPMQSQPSSPALLHGTRLNWHLLSSWYNGQCCSSNWPRPVFDRSHAAFNVTDEPRHAQCRQQFVEEYYCKQCSWHACTNAASVFRTAHVSLATYTSAGIANGFISSDPGVHVAGQSPTKVMEHVVSRWIPNMAECLCQHGNTLRVRFLAQNVLAHGTGGVQRTFGINSGHMGCMQRTTRRHLADVLAFQRCPTTEIVVTWSTCRPGAASSGGHPGGMAPTTSSSMLLWLRAFIFVAAHQPGARMGFQMGGLLYWLHTQLRSRRPVAVLLAPA